MNDTETVHWYYDTDNDDHYARANGISYHVIRVPHRDRWNVSVWPTGDGRENVVRRQDGLPSLAEAKTAALAMKPGE